MESYSEVDTVKKKQACRNILEQRDLLLTEAEVEDWQDMEETIKSGLPLMWTQEFAGDFNQDAQDITGLPLLELVRAKDAGNYNNCSDPSKPRLQPEIQDENKKSQKEKELESLQRERCFNRKR